MQHDNTTDQTPPMAEQQVAGLIARFEPKDQKLIKAVRKALQKRFSTVNELVYDYTRSLVISYSPTERGSDAVVAMSADADGLRLYFNYGMNLPDPHNILLGNGRQTRYIRIEESKDLLRPEVEALIAAATANATVPISSSGSGALIIKSSKKQAKSAKR